MMPDAASKTPKWKHGRWAWMLLLAVPLLYAVGSSWYYGWKFDTRRVAGLAPREVLDKLGSGWPRAFSARGAEGRWIEMSDQEHLDRLAAGEEGSIIYRTLLWEAYEVRFKAGVAEGIIHHAD